MVVVLCNIRSLHNVGSILRTADAVGVEKIYLCGITPSPLDILGNYRPQISKVALGAEQIIKWEKCKRAGDVLKELKKEGYKIVAVEQSSKAQSLYKIKLNNYFWNKLALVLGNEIKGLSPSLLKKADKILEIPMYGKKESLNVAVAFGIAAFYLRGKIKK